MLRIYIFFEPKTFKFHRNSNFEKNILVLLNYFVLTLLHMPLVQKPSLKTKDTNDVETI